MKIGVIGSGFIMQTLHLPALRASKNVTLAAIYDADNDNLSGVARAYAIDSFTVSLDEILGRSDIDAFVISLPRQAMPAIIGTTLLTGKHVFAEKPLAYTVEDVEKICSIKRNGQILRIGYMKTFDENYTRFKNLVREGLESGRFGRLMSVNVQNFCGKYYADIPPHIRRKHSRPSRFAQWSTQPKFLPEEYAGHYDYMINVVGHSIDLVCDIFADPVPVPLRLFADPTNPPIFAVLGLGAASISISAAPSRLGRWHEIYDVYFETSLIRLELASPFSPAGASRMTVFSDAGDKSFANARKCASTPCERQIDAFVSSVREGGESAADMAAFLRNAHIVSIMENLWRMRV